MGIKKRDRREDAKAKPIAPGVFREPVLSVAPPAGLPWEETTGAW